MLSKDVVGCTLVIFGMAVAFLAAEPWSFHAILEFFVFDFSPNSTNHWPRFCHSRDRRRRAGSYLSPAASSVR